MPKKNFRIFIAALIFLTESGQRTPIHAARSSKFGRPKWGSVVWPRSMIELKAKPVVQKKIESLSGRVDVFRAKYNRTPHLAVVLVGEDPASMIYTQKKGEMAVRLGMNHQTLRFPANRSSQSVFEEVMKLNSDPKVDGILIQRPLPPQFKEEELIYWVDPSKDVDAFHPTQTGLLHLKQPCLLPCTPAGVMELLKYYKIDCAHKTACVLGRSSIVGKPMAAMLLNHDATVIQCHSKTTDLKSLSRLADILVVAIGKPHIIDESFIKKGAIVVDVGIHRNNSGRLVGDVNPENLDQIAAALTPVPGGVGPMTIMMLMENTILAAEQREKKE